MTASTFFRRRLFLDCTRFGDDAFALQDKIDEHYVVARKSGDLWRVSAIAREKALDLFAMASRHSPFEDISLLLIMKRFQPFITAFVSSILLYLSLCPQFRLKYLVFLVPAFWTALALAKPSRKGNTVASNSDDLDKANDQSQKKRGFGSRVGAFLTREYVQIWLASFIFWLVTVHWVSYPHPIITVGWIIMSGYLALYLPFYIGLCRTMNALLRLPIWVASPICWVTVEWARNRVLGGFSFAGLSHAIYDVPILIQLAEPLGEYGVGGAIALIGSLIGSAFVYRFRVQQVEEGRKSARMLSFAAIALLAVVLYGRSRIAYFDAVELDAKNYGHPSLKIALMQDCTQYRFPPAKGLNLQVSDKYKALAAKASKEEGGYDLIVWPEGCYYGFFFDTKRDYNRLIDSFDSIHKIAPGEKASEEELKREFPLYSKLDSSAKKRAQFDLLFARDRMLQQRRTMLEMTSRLNAAAILGVASAVFDEDGEPTSYNSAVYVPYLGDKAQVDALTNEELACAPTYSLFSESASFFRRYSKIHLVLFGEYIPFLEYIPDSWEIKGVCAESILGRGEGPAAFRVSPKDSNARFILAPNVCFESSIPHLIKAHLREYKKADADPDVLLNVSHDGWFRCGIETDLHLATNVFRAIENRRHVISATHGGFSTWIAPSGKIRAIGERGKEQIVKAEICSVKVKRQGVWENLDLGEAWSFGCALLAFSTWCAFGLICKLRKIKDKRKHLS